MAEKKQSTKVVHVSGKRKSATARVTLKAGKGIVKINSFLIDNYKLNECRLARLIFCFEE